MWGIALVRPNSAPPSISHPPNPTPLHRSTMRRRELLLLALPKNQHNDEDDDDNDDNGDDDTSDGAALDLLLAALATLTRDEVEELDGGAGVD